MAGIAHGAGAPQVAPQGGRHSHAHRHGIRQHRPAFRQEGPAGTIQQRDHGSGAHQQIAGKPAAAQQFRRPGKHIPAQKAHHRQHAGHHTDAHLRHVAPVGDHRQLALLHHQQGHGRQCQDQRKGQPDPLALQTAAIHRLHLAQRLLRADDLSVIRLRFHRLRHPGAFIEFFRLHELPPGEQSPSGRRQQFFLQHLVHGAAHHIRHGDGLDGLVLGKPQGPRGIHRFFLCGRLRLRLFGRFFRILAGRRILFRRRFFPLRRRLLLRRRHALLPLCRFLLRHGTGHFRQGRRRCLLLRLRQDAFGTPAVFRQDLLQRKAAVGHTVHHQSGIGQFFFICTFPVFLSHGIFSRAGSAQRRSVDRVSSGAGAQPRTAGWPPRRWHSGT